MDGSWMVHGHSRTGANDRNTADASDFRRNDMGCGNYKFPTSKDGDAKRVAAGGAYKNFKSFTQGLGNFKQK